MLEVQSSAFVFIDVQKAFTAPNGTLANVYGKAELEPIEIALERLLELALRISELKHLYFVKSDYTPGQFTSNDLAHPYAYLCTGKNVVDGEWSLPTAVLSNRLAFTKKSKSLYSIPELRQVLLQGDFKNIYLLGFLFTSCVAESALEMRANLSKDTKITVVEDACGARLSKFQVCNGDSEYSSVKKKLINNREGMSNNYE